MTNRKFIYVWKYSISLHLGELGVAHALGEDPDDRLVGDALEVAADRRSHEMLSQSTPPAAAGPRIRTARSM
jgi:hypothetical protein